MRKHWLSHLAHVEIYSPKMDETVKFFRDVIGLNETERTGSSVYLRGWGDYYHHSLKITEGPSNGLGHIGWRADSPEALEECVRYLESTGAGVGWIEGDRGHGRAYRYKAPDGHLHELFWEVDCYQAAPELKSKWKNRPSKNTGKGVSPRRIDHVTIQCADPKKDREFYQSLGFKYHEGIHKSPRSDIEMGAWLSVTNLSHDMALVRDPFGHRGVLNHVCYAVESREEVLLAADHIIESGYELEMGGPTRHALAEGFFFYVVEPGGNRFELYAGAHLIFPPDFGPVIWYLSENPNDAWGRVSPWDEDGNIKPEFLAHQKS